MVPSKLLVIALLIVLSTSLAMSQADAPSAARSALGKLPVYIVENRGVYPDEVRYYIRGADKTLFFADEGVTIALKGKERGWTVKLDFEGASRDARPEGQEKQQAVFSYFTGAKEDWRVGLPTFSKLVYRDLWPGIDLVYRARVNALKYEFVVAPGADPARIRLRYRGASSVKTTKAGALRVETPEGAFEDAPPHAWQDVDGRRVPVAMGYDLGKDQSLGFAVADHDRTRPLILDPAIIVYCGYIGGSGQDNSAGVGVDASGNTYVTGCTDSDERTFPVNAGPDLTHRGGPHSQVFDAFVAKVNAGGTALVYCGYIGGAGYDSSSGIAVDAAGNAYVVGITGSDEKTFPVKVGPDLTHNGGYQGPANDGFVAKVNATGTALDYCGYIGGSGQDEARGIAVDAAGNAYVTGCTDSDEKTFPVRVGPDLAYNGGSDAFVARVNARGTALDYCGYIGGSGVFESGHGIAVDGSGAAYVVGVTDSTEASFPVKGGPDLSHNGAFDAFVAKVTPRGSALAYCGYIGGSKSDFGWQIAIDSLGHPLVTGTTESTETTFPVTQGPDLTHNGGPSIAPEDGFVAKVNTTGGALVYCGYLGGNSMDRCTGIAVDAAGNAYVTGWTGSDERSFPVVGGLDLTHNGDMEAFLAKIAHTLLQASGTPRPGGTVAFDLTATDAAGRHYQIGSSLGNGPMQIGQRRIGLSPDHLLAASVSGLLPGVFASYRGVIGSQGHATAALHIPPIPALIGTRVFSAFVALDPAEPAGLRSISNTFMFTIVK